MAATGRSSPRSLARSAIEEIGADPALRLYGAALAAVHIPLFYFWQQVAAPAVILAPGVPPICWPFFENCGAWRVLPPAAIQALLYLHVGIALLAAAAFLGRRLSVAWVLLLVAELFQLLFVVQDYRLRANQHLMSLWVTLVFLLIPGKRRVLPLLVVGFYVWAGLLKLDADWLSGAALYGERPLFVPEALVPAACAYVLVLELIVVPMLLGQNTLLFWAALAQVVLFHVVSWTIVGFFYPLLMLGIITLFPLLRLLGQSRGDAAADRRAWRNAVATIAVFSLAQLPPLLFPGDSSLTGEGRLLALHMFDAPVVCAPRMTVHFRDGRSEERPVSAAVPIRIHCDPLVYWNLTREHCRRLSAKPEFRDLDLRLAAGRKSDPAMHTLVDVKDFCTNTPTYDVWRHNAWIQP